MRLFFVKGSLVHFLLAYPLFLLMLFILGIADGIVRDPLPKVFVAFSAIPVGMFALYLTAHNIPIVVTMKRILVPSSVQTKGKMPFTSEYRPVNWKDIGNYDITWGILTLRRSINDRTEIVLKKLSDHDREELIRSVDERMAREGVTRTRWRRS